MAKEMTGLTKGLLIFMGLGVVFGGFKGYQHFLAPAAGPALVPTSGKLTEFKETAPVAASEPTSMPSATPANLPGPQVRMQVIPWNAQMGLLYANGGAQTTDGSLMARYGVNLRVDMQDDYGKQKQALLECAQQLAKGAEDCTAGAHFVTMMGDAAAMYMAGLNATLAPLGPDFQAEIIGGFGRSFGEDKFMAPPECVKNPSACKGALIAGVLMDGDWNIAMFWAANNNICNNADVTTYNPECLNWFGTSTFVEADNAYINGYCEDRPIVQDGKRLGSKNICVNGVVTWTPGDVEVTKKKGGLASILSTAQTGSQMPNVVIGIKHWNTAHADLVTKMLRAGYEGGNTVRTDPEALTFAGGISATVYGQEDAAYWSRYYRGVTEMDKTGKIEVPLGGSRVFTAADAFAYFGLDSGAANAFATTYTIFGDIAKQQYPKDLPSYPAVGTVFNPAYLQALKAEKTLVSGVVEQPNFSEPPAVVTKIADKSWDIRFRSNSADFDPTAQKALQALLDQLVVGSELRVQLHGHTDGQGDDEANMSLSERRAFAVKRWLESHAPSNFPDGRISVQAHGETQPVAPNSTDAGRARNRRVQVVLTAG